MYSGAFCRIERQRLSTGSNKMKNNVYGYVRVSTKEQNEARQLIAMREFGIEEQNVFVEKEILLCKAFKADAHVVSFGTRVGVLRSSDASYGVYRQPAVSSIRECFILADRSWNETLFLM